MIADRVNARGRAVPRDTKGSYPVSQEYGHRHERYINPIKNPLGIHFGEDTATPTGTPIYAPLDGVIRYAGWENVANPKQGYGINIFLYMPSVDQTYMSAHLSAVRVKVGQQVKKGDLLGYTGTTGNSTAPHKHTGMYIGDVSGNVLSQVIKPEFI